MRKALLEIRAQFGLSVFEGQVLTGYAKDQYPEMEKAEQLMLRQAESDQLPRRLKRLLNEPESSRESELVRMRRGFKVDNGFDDRATVLFDILSEVYGLASSTGVSVAPPPPWPSSSSSVASPPPLPTATAAPPQTAHYYFSTYTETVNGVSFKMIAVQGGDFTMGDMFGEGDKGETPHPVSLSDYFLGETSVTQELWTAVMGSNPSHFKGSADLPVEMVSWEDAQVFIQKLNHLTGKAYRLPTEAEWEYAARERGRKVRFGNGKDVADPVKMNFNGSIAEKYSVQGTGQSKTTPVKMFAPNALRLHDMSGNVWEWCSDWYEDYPTVAQKNPQGAPSGSDRVYRGGGWNGGPRFCRASYRNGDTPADRRNYLGFRLASPFIAPPPSLEHTIPTIYTETVKGVSFGMVEVRGGDFTMGDMFGEGQGDETPHPVTLSDYFLGETPVTRGLWKAVMGSAPGHPKQSDDLPVDMVSWEDAQGFIEKLNKMTSKTYRLPTEAEWEYAARERGRKVRFGNGKDIADPEEMNLHAIARGLENYVVQGVRRNKMIPVKMFSPNALRLHDMSGNVWEWCSDWYEDYPTVAQKNPMGPRSGSDRVCRGGCWSDNPFYCRVSTRAKAAPGHFGNKLGFRLASG